MVIFLIAVDLKLRHLKQVDKSCTAGRLRPPQTQGPPRSNNNRPLEGLETTLERSSILSPLLFMLIHSQSSHPPSAGLESRVSALRN